MERGITICDTERDYAMRLMEFFYAHADFPCSLRVCTEPERLGEISPPEATQLLIISQSAAGLVKDPSVYPCRLFLTEGDGERPEGEERQIGKYNSPSAVLSAARRIYLEEGPALPLRSSAAGPLRISGIYSPAGGCLKTSTALTLGRILGEERRSLYVSLEACSGLARRLGIDLRGSLADLVYYSACSPDRFASQVALLACRWETLDILPPMRSWMELQSVTESEWQGFLDALGERTEYEELVLDLTEQADGFTGLLRRCGRLWIPEGQTAAAEAKLENFREILQKHGAEDIWSTARTLPLPAMRSREWQEETGETGEAFTGWVREQLAAERRRT